jgi:hypothetical protein
VRLRISEEAARTSVVTTRRTDVSALIRLAHVPAKRIRFTDEDMRQHENLQRFPVISNYWVIQNDREAP